jgi:glycerophosphoryl diester phosphodiesterase
MNQAKPRQTCSVVLAVMLLAGCSDSNSPGTSSIADLSVHSTAIPEGAAGEQQQLVFEVSATRPLAAPIVLSYQTRPGSAVEGEDYLAASGDIEMAAGQQFASLAVTLLGDDVEEIAENFSLALSVSGAARLTSSSATGTLSNDDSACVLPFVQQPNPWLVGDADPLNYAHRGGVIDFPENTLYAYKEAALAGVDVLEMDVYQTLDNQLVIIHDLDVDRTTNGSGNIRDLTLAQLRGLDAAYWFVQGVGTPHDATDEQYLFRGIATGQRPPPPGYRAEDFRIPTLEEALMAFPDELLNVELKPDLDGVGNYEQQIAETLIRYGRFDDVIAASFVDEAANRFKAVAPCIHTSVPLDQATTLILGSLGDAVMPPVPEHVSFQVPPDTSQVQQVPDGITVVTPDMIKDSHDVGLAVQVWTINECEQMLELISLGVDALMTDRPILLRDLLAQPRGQRSCEGLSS